MSRGYRELNVLPPAAFLEPADFATSYDHQPDYAARQHALGVLTSLQAVSVSISCSGTWGATLSNGVVTSSEGIGYHAHTADLLRGFLDGPAPVIVHRWDGPAGGTVIKPRTCPKCGKAVAPGIQVFNGEDCPQVWQRA